MKKLIICFAAAALVFGASIASAAAAETFEVSSNTFAVDGMRYRFSERSFTYLNETYIPFDDVLRLFGYSVGWDYEQNAAVADNGRIRAVIPLGSYSISINGEEKEYAAPTLIFHNLGYISLTQFADLVPGLELETDASVKARPAGVRDAMSDISVPFDCRVEENTSAQFGSLRVLNGEYAFEPVEISESGAAEYTSIVNGFGERLPDANVYNILIPDSYEIYAPESYSTGQLDSMRRVYQGLNENVTPINIVDSLFEKADEKIYFSTDHHWTQRGAYYAYRAFLDYNDLAIEPLSAFENVPSDSFTGSFAEELSGIAGAENALNKNTETLERFLPIYDTEVNIYLDMETSLRIGSVPLVNTGNNSYSAFISGDYPLTAIDSSVGNGRSLVLIKDSFGDAFATWAVNNYSRIYVVDLRGFNGVSGNDHEFDIAEFYELTGFDDLIILSYPTSVAAADLRAALAGLL